MAFYYDDDEEFDDEEEYDDEDEEYEDEDEEYADNDYQDQDYDENNQDLEDDGEGDGYGEDTGDGYGEDINDENKKEPQKDKNPKKGKEKQGASNSTVKGNSLVKGNKQFKDNAKRYGFPTTVVLRCPRCKQLSLFPDKTGKTFGRGVMSSIIGYPSQNSIVRCVCMNKKCRAYWPTHGITLSFQGGKPKKIHKNIFHITK